MKIEPIHAFSDNFIWALRNESGDVVVVDPGDATPVLAYLAAHEASLSAVLITHKHPDHVGGLAQLIAHDPGLPVYGPAGEPIGALTVRLGDGDVVELPQWGLHFEVLAVPGHTEAHIAYYRRGPDPLLFCGDTVFSVGCGRVFSGTHAQLHQSLQRIAALPPQTRLYCAHEYTLDNIGFAKWVEPANTALHQREEQAHAQLDAGADTVPVTLATELACNPFLRVHAPTVIDTVQRYAGRPMRNAEDTFTTLRGWKDREYD